MKWFEIKPADEGVVKLDEKTLKGELTFTVTNVSGKALRARAAVFPRDAEQKHWMSVKGKDIRAMTEDGQETFVVSIAAPKDASPGTYSITFVICNEADPEEETAQVEAAFEVVKPAAIDGGKRRLWPWVAGGIGALVIVGIIAVVLVLVLRGSPPEDGGEEVLVAKFTSSNPSGTAPLTVSFTDLSEGDPNGWMWTFGAAGTSTEKDPNVIFQNPGTYDVTLTAIRGTEKDTVVVTGCVTVTAKPVPPSAQFMAEVLAARSEQNIDGRPVALAAFLPLARAGSVTVKEGLRQPVERFKAITPDRLAEIVPLRSILINPGDTIRFIDLSKGEISSWSWDFGAGEGGSTTQHPRHTYKRLGTFTVSLTVTGTGGSDTETKQGFIRVIQ